MKKIICIFFVVMVYACGSSDDNQIYVSDQNNWNRTYQVTNYKSGRDFIQTSDGGYFLCGETASFSDGRFYIKTDAVGFRQWAYEVEAEVYGGGRTSFPGHAVIETEHGDFLAAASFVNMVYSTQIFVTKLDIDGNLIFQQTYEPTESIGRSWNFGGDIDIIQATANEFLIICNAITYPSGDSSLFALRIDAEGNLIFIHNFEGITGSSVIKNENGTFLIVGSASEPYVDIESRDQSPKLSIIEIDNSGKELWRKSYGFGYFSDVQKNEEGDYYLLGTAFSSDTVSFSSFDVCLYKIDSTGNEISKKIYDFPENNYGNHLRKVHEDEFIIQYRRFQYADYSYSTPYLVKRDEDGNIIYGTDYLLQIDSDGNEIRNKELDDLDVRQVRVVENGYVILSNSSEGTILRKMDSNR
ncbi:MAG: hypothetical protein C4522_17835 [Desulfobacteraceae bacterium]|nr:MAG: hypothetical protein C4522_17835 [Desulfobacteraceae bacterium]